MTNRNLATGNFKRPHNIHDGHGARCPSRKEKEARNTRFEALGFTRLDWNSWQYTLDGEFPVFDLEPGIVEDKAGLVARCDEADIEILFRYESTPDEIKSQLDDEIEDILGHQADVVEGEDEFSRLIDEVSLLSIFEDNETTRSLEVSASGLTWITRKAPDPVERWLKRPLWHYRPAIAELAARHGISNDDAAEMYKMKD